MKQISKDELLRLFDGPIQAEITERLRQGYVDGIIVFENNDLSSSQVGARSAVVFGEPYTIKTPDAVADTHLHDLPSQRQYPVSYYTKPKD